MVLLYFMDGVKFEMMQKYMPFVSGLNTKALISDFGYSCACHATMYTSRYVDEHETWFVWKKGEKSPYKWINYVPGLKYINFLPLKLVIGKVTQKFSRNTSFPGIPCLVNLPLKYWPLFETTENVFWNDSLYKPEFPNMFTILSKNNIKHQIIALSRNGNPFKEEENVDYNNTDFAYFFIGYTDNIMHSYGEDASESKEYFKKVDEFVKNSYEKACNSNEEVTIIVYSDHGHIDIQDPKIDINNFFKDYKLKVNKYVHLIESTFARFWFRNEEERKEVTKVLEKMEMENLGFVLTQAHYDKYHLNLNPKEHGELIFHLKAPYEFTKTIWGFGKTVKSAHGFEPTLEKHHGFFASNKTLALDQDYAYLVDVLPTIMEQLNIKRSQYILRGKNIVNTEEAN